MDSSRQLSPEAELLAAPVESFNQRLEFLGDAVLELITTHHLFVLFAAADEGDLSSHRTALVNNANPNPNPDPNPNPSPDPYHRTALVSSARMHLECQFYH